MSRNGGVLYCKECPYGLQPAFGINNFSLCIGTCFFLLLQPIYDLDTNIVNLVSLRVLARAACIQPTTGLLPRDSTTNLS
jgi:hypothetical protein